MNNIDRLRYVFATSAAVVSFGGVVSAAEAADDPRPPGRPSAHFIGPAEGDTAPPQPTAELSPAEGGPSRKAILGFWTGVTVVVGGCAMIAPIVEWQGKRQDRPRAYPVLDAEMEELLKNYPLDEH